MERRVRLWMLEVLDEAGRVLVRSLLPGPARPSERALAEELARLLLEARLVHALLEGRISARVYPVEVRAEISEGKKQG